MGSAQPLGLAHCSSRLLGLHLLSIMLRLSDMENMQMQPSSLQMSTRGGAAAGGALQTRQPGAALSASAFLRGNHFSCTFSFSEPA